MPSVSGKQHRLMAAVAKNPEFAKRVKRGDAFLRKVLEQSRIWLIGSDDVLAAR